MATRKTRKVKALVAKAVAAATRKVKAKALAVKAPAVVIRKAKALAAVTRKTLKASAVKVLVGVPSNDTVYLNC